MSTFNEVKEAIELRNLCREFVSDHFITDKEKIQRLHIDDAILLIEIICEKVGYVSINDR